MVLIGKFVSNTCLHNLLLNIYSEIISCLIGWGEKNELFLIIAKVKSSWEKHSNTKARDFS